MKIWVNNEEEMQSLMRVLNGHYTWQGGSRASDYPKLLQTPVAIVLRGGTIFWTSRSVYDSPEEQEAYIRSCVQAQDVLNGNIPLVLE